MTTKDFLQELQDKAVMVMDKLEELSPQMVEIVLKVISLEGGLYILSGAALMVAAIPLMYLCYRYMLRERELPFADKFEGNFFMMSASGVVAIAFVAIGFFMVIYVHNWIAFLYPEGSLALKVLDKF